MLQIRQTDTLPAFADEKTDNTDKYVKLITASPDYEKLFDDWDNVSRFLLELTAHRDETHCLRFVGFIEQEEVVYLAATGMNLPKPEIQIIVKEGYRNHGYGTEMLHFVMNWLFVNTEKEAFLYRLVCDNDISERLVKSIGGRLLEPTCDLEKAIIKTYMVSRNDWIAINH